MNGDSTGYGNFDEFTITTADDQSGDLYFTVETYYLGQVSYMCQFLGLPWAHWMLYQNDELIGEA